MNKTLIASSLLTLFISGASSAATLAYDGSDNEVKLYNFSGLEFEHKDNDDGTSELFSKQIFIDGAVVFPKSDWRVGVFAASWQSNPSEGSTTNGKDFEIKPTYETAITDSWNVGNEFVYAPGNGKGDIFKTKPFTFFRATERVSIFAESLWEISAGGRSGFNGNLIHPMYKVTDNLTVGVEVAYNLGLKSNTSEEVAIRPNFSYRIDDGLSVWGKVEIGDQSDQEDSTVDGEYIKYAAGYNKRLNETFTLVNEISLFSWDDNLNKTGGDNIFFKVGLAY